MKRFIAGFCLFLLIFPAQCFFAFAQQRKTKPQPISPAPVTNQETAKPLVNADIVRLSKAGLADAVIVKVIGAGKSKFDLSVEGLIRLKNAGVSQAVIEAMQNSSAAASANVSRQQIATVAVQQKLPPPENQSLPVNSLPLPPPASNGAQRQPIAVLIGQSSGEHQQRQIMTPAAAQIVETKTKGGDLALIARDDAVAVALGTAAAEAAARTGIAMGGAAASMPVLGAIIGGGMILGGMLRRKPQITYVAALGGQSSALTADAAAAPKFEISFGDITGVNPDEFEPVIVRLTPTPNNWRLVYARKAKLGKSASEVKFYTDYTEDRVPVKTVKIERGRFQIEPGMLLAAGEYAVALRPVSKTRVFSMNNRDDAAAFTLTQVIWDFAVK